MLATNIGTGLVVGQFVLPVVDGPDLDREPELVPMSGEVTFTPSISHLPVIGDTPEDTFTLVMAPIKAVLDNGFLCTPSSDGVTPQYQGIRLIATDAPNGLTKNWFYTVTYRFKVINGVTPTIKTHAMSVLVGSERDLTRDVDVPSSPAIGTPQAFALLAKAEAAATDSATSAAVALQVKADADAGVFDGEPGPPGPNTIPTQQAVADAITTPGSPALAALSGTIGAQFAPLEIASLVGEGHWAKTFAPPVSVDLPIITLETTAAGTVTVVPTTDPVTESHYLFGGITAMDSPTAGFVRTVTDFPTVSPYANAAFVTEKTDKIDLAFKAVSSGTFRIRIWVNGQPVNIQMPTYPLTAGVPRFLRLTFPQARSRRIKVEWADTGLSFGGAVVAGGQSVYRPASLPGPKIAVLGDSFVGGANTAPDGATRAETFAWYVAALMGASDWRSYGHGGTGYVASVNPFSQRVPLIAAWQPDIVIAFGTINDGGSNHAAIRDAALNVFAGLASTPAIYAIGPVSKSAAMPNEAVREAALRSGLPFIDGLTDPWITAAETGTDDTHPTFAGHQHLAAKVYAGIKSVQRISTGQAVITPAEPIPVPEILTKGSMLLVEPGLWAAGTIPSNASTVPNEAWAQAAAALGTGTEATLAATVVRDANTASTLVLERSTKGGLHGMFSQTTTTAAAAPSNWILASINLPAEVINRIVASPTDDWYVSTWARITKLSSGTPQYSTMSYIAHKSDNARSLAQITPQQIVPGSGNAEYIAATNGTHTLGAPQRRSVAVNSWRGTVPAIASDIQASVAMFGNGSPIARTERGSGVSYVLYRAYVENLTLSGRTFAQVEAIDAAQYGAAFGAGGRYSGDTFSDPSVTVP